MKLFYRSYIFIRSVKEITVIIAQLKSKLGDKKYNFNRMLDIISKISDSVPSLIVFPELYITGYLSKDINLMMPETLYDSMINELISILKKRRNSTVVIFGTPFLNEEDRLIYNAAIIVDSKKGVFTYFKRHLPSYGVFDEARYFASFNKKIEVFNTSIGKIGVLICYDLFFPEISRAEILQGAEILVTISAAPDMSRDFFNTFTRARAMENTVFLVYVNTVGFYDGLGFFGGSKVIDPLGKVIVEAKYYKEDIRETTIDLEDIKRLRSIRPILKDISFSDIISLSETLKEKYFLGTSL